MFKFIPVPASQYLDLVYHADTAFEIRMYDVTGQLIKKLQFRGGTSRQPIDIEKFTDGIYFYEITRSRDMLKRGSISIIKNE